MIDSQYKYEPGIWEMEDRGDEGVVITTGGGRVLIAALAPPDPNDPEALETLWGDASLISAAPELLRAVSVALALLGTGEMDVKAPRAMAGIRAAMAKAKGSERQRGKAQ